MQGTGYERCLLSPGPVRVRTGARYATEQLPSRFSGSDFRMLQPAAANHVRVDVRIQYTVGTSYSATVLPAVSISPSSPQSTDTQKLQDPTEQHQVCLLYHAPVAFSASTQSPALPAPMRSHRRRRFSPFAAPTCPVARADWSRARRSCPLPGLYQVPARLEICPPCLFTYCQVHVSGT